VASWKKRQRVQSQEAGKLPPENLWDEGPRKAGRETSLAQLESQQASLGDLLPSFLIVGSLAKLTVEVKAGVIELGRDASFNVRVENRFRIVITGKIAAAAAPGALDSRDRDFNIRQSKVDIGIPFLFGHRF
jgi:hypothetical protein